MVLQYARKHVHTRMNLSVFPSIFWFVQLDSGVLFDGTVGSVSK